MVTRMLARGLHNVVSVQMSLITADKTVSRMCVGIKLAPGQRYALRSVIQPCSIVVVKVMSACCSDMSYKCDLLWRHIQKAGARSKVIVPNKEECGEKKRHERI